jgi:NCAIR mutase (PurE)-related protein
MKLQELAASPTKQAAKVFESYFGGRIRLNTISRRQTRNLLGRVRGLVQEHRRTREFHKSEKNPTYLKLIMLEQVLTKKMHEDVMPMAGAIPATTNNPAQAQQQRKKALTDQITAITKQIEEMNKQKAALQQAMNSPAAMVSAMENRKNNRLYRRLQESEIQQAQVVLAAQDMVDRVQKMLEDVTSMQFKDLPALCDQVKNEVGVEQSVQFNTDANAALGGLVQNLQASKQQLEQALGVVTGQGGAVPPAMDALDGAGLPDDGQMAAPEMDAEMPADDLEADLDIDANMKTPPAALGRGRR